MVRSLTLLSSSTEKNNCIQKSKQWQNIIFGVNRPLYSNCNTIAFARCVRLRLKHLLACTFPYYMQTVLVNLSDLILLIVLVTLLTKDLADSILCMLSYSRMTHAYRWWMSCALFSLLDMVNTLLHRISSCMNALQMRSSNVSCNKKVLAWLLGMNPTDSLRCSARQSISLRCQLVGTLLRPAACNKSKC